MLQKRKIVFGVTLIVSIILQGIAFLMLLIPISGFVLYPIIGLVSVIVGMISWRFAGELKIAKIISLIVWIMFLLFLIVEVSFLIRFMF